MKLLLALILVTSSVMAAEKPSYGVDVDENTKTVTLEVFNNDDAEVECRYSVSYFVNVINFKKQFGTMILGPKSGASVSYFNDKADLIARARANVSCE